MESWGLGLGFRVSGFGFFGLRVGYCPHPVTVDIRGPIKGYIYNTCPTVTEGGQYPSLGFRTSVQGLGSGGVVEYEYEEVV